MFDGLWMAEWGIGRVARGASPQALPGANKSSENPSGVDGFVDRARRSRLPHFFGENDLNLVVWGIIVKFATIND